jgi:DNA-binding SARP family transcriptional activator
MTRKLTVQLMGRFRVEVDGTGVPDREWRRRRASALVKLLSLAPAHRLTRDALIEALWPDLPPRAAGANLRKAAYFARRILGADDSVVLDGETVSLLPSGVVETDVERFEAAARSALERRDADACRTAAALYGGELPPDDVYEAWSEGPRAELSTLFRDVLESGGLWGRLLEVDATSEPAHRGIMRERMAAGDRAGALRQFEELRTVLRDELGVSPDPASMGLYEQVLAAEGRDAPTPAERARALLAWGTVHWERADLDEAARTAEEARALAIDAELGRELAEASELLALVAYAQGRWREVFADRFVETAERTEELAPFVLDANLCMSEFALHEPDGMSAVGGFAGELLDTAERSGSVQIRALGLLLRGEVELLGGGDLEVARRELDDSIRLHAGEASPTGEAIALERLAQATALGGARAEAQQRHRQALERAAGTAVANHLLPLIYGGLIEASEGGEALQAVHEGEATLRELQRTCAPCSMSFHIGAAKTCAATEPERARSHLDQAAQIATMWRGGPWHAAVAEARAMLLSSDGGDASEVRSLLEEAAAGFEAGGRRRDAERCRDALAELAGRERAGTPGERPRS